MVEEELAGRGNQLKEYVLGVGVFGRPADFDPRLDSLVRVEARRLRAALQTLGELVLKSTGPLGPNKGLALDPLGRFVYGTNTTANNVQADAIDPSEGTLTEALGSPWGTGTFPIAAAVDTTGRFLYVVNRDSNTVSGFTINQQTGALTPMSSPTFATGNKPVAILTTGTIQ